MQSIAIHSHKGGVGKTTIAVNLAVMLAQEGGRVCLIDADFSAPNLQTFFDVETDQYLNRYFENKIGIKDCLHKVTLRKEMKGELYIGLADPTPNSINSMVRLDSKSATNMLTRLLKLKAAIKSEPYDMDYLILDTTPGIGLTTINSFVLTENILFLIKLSNADLEGTTHMITGLLEKLPNESYLIANQIPVNKIKDEEKRNRLAGLVDKHLKGGSTAAAKIDFLGWIATDSKLQEIEFDNAVESLNGNKYDRVIFTMDLPDHPFSETLQEIRTKLFSQS